MDIGSGSKIAVLIPCYNEELTIKRVVSDFACELPQAEIFVYDNNSTDDTVKEAISAGASVRYEYAQGKGHVVRRMFSEIEADIYVLVDGDDTYPADAVKEMVRLVEEGRADMVNGDRLSNGTYTSENKRRFHNFGNDLVRKTINLLFHSDIKDIMTGYRVFNRKFIKNFPVMSKGFEIETEMTIHALDKGYTVSEVPVLYRDRPEGSESKLNTFVDGFKVLNTIFEIFKDYRPLSFFGTLALIVCFAGCLVGLPVIMDYIWFRYVYHVPLAILAAALEMLSLNLLTCGLILDTVAKNDRKNYELRLLDYGASGYLHTEGNS